MRNWLIAALVGVIAGTTLGGDWPQAMGPGRNGVVADEKIVAPAAGQSPKVAWHANAGHASSPVVVAGGRVYVYGVFKPGTTVEQLAEPASTPSIAEVRAATTGKEPAVRSGAVPGTPEWARQEEHGIFRGEGYVQCLDAATGKRLWATKLTDWGIVFWGNWLNTERSSPAVADGRLFVHTMSGRLYCLDAATGSPQWETNLFDHGMLRWEEKNGNASSPLVVGDVVMVSFLAGKDADPAKYWQPTGTAVAGFDVATGKVRWVTKLPLAAFRSMSSDIGFAAIGGEPTVLVPGGMGTAGLNPADGTIRWMAEPSWMEGFRIWAQYPGRMPLAWKDYVVDCTTIAHDDKPSQTWVVQVTSGKPQIVWTTHDFVPGSAEQDKSNMLVADGRVYGFDAHGVWDDPQYDKEREVFRLMRKEGRFQCRDMATGKLLWHSDALNIAPAGQGEYYNPSHLVLAGDVLVVVERQGLQFARLKGDGVEVLGQFGKYVQHASHLHSPPVVSGGRLFVRKNDADPGNGLLTLFPGAGNLICFDLRP